MSAKYLEELRIIAAANKGVLKAEAVVEFARDPETALHRRFTWDDGEAAHQWRLQQARQLIRCTVTMIPQADEPYRAYVSMIEDRHKKGGGYRDTVTILTHEDSREALLEQARQELETWRQKYKDLKELAGIFAAMDETFEAKPKRQKVAARVG